MSGLEAPQISLHQCPGTGRFLCRVRLDEPGPDSAPIRVRWTGLAENPAAPEELLAVLAKSDSRLVHLTLAHREDLPGSAGETLADRCLATGDEHLTHALACNDQLPERVVRELAMSADPAVRAAVAVAPVLERDLVQSLLNDPEPVVRRALAFRTGLDLSLRERLAHDPDPDVRESLGYQHDLPEPILTILARDPNPGVRVQVISRLARHWLPELADDPDPMIRSEVARHRDARADLLDQLSRDEDSSVRLAVCRAHRVSAKLLAVLAADSDAEVRAAVACEGKTPDTVVRSLADDSHAGVRGAAQVRLAADLSTPSDVLPLLISSDGPIEQALAGLALATNPNTPPAILADLAQGDHEHDVLREACAHPALPHPVMWHLAAPLTGTTG